MNRLTSSITTFVLILVTSLHSINAQNLKPVFSETKKAYGAVNTKGEIIIPYEYGSMKSAKDIIIAKTADLKKFVFFTPEGKKIAGFYDSTFDDYKIIKPGIYAMKAGQLWGLSSEKEPAPLLLYDDILPGKRHGIVIRIGKRYGLLGDDFFGIILGEMLEKPPLLVKNQYYIFRKENKLGCIDTLGSVVIPFVLDEQKVTTDYTTALPFIEKMLNIDPENEEIMYLACLGKYMNSNSSEALAYTNTLAAPLEKKDPKSVKLSFSNYFRTLIYSDQGDYVRAKSAKSLLPVKKDYDSYWVRACIYIGNTYFKSGDYSFAQKAYAEASPDCEQSQKLAGMAAKEFRISTSLNPSERSGIWVPGAADPFPVSWDQKLKDPAEFLFGHFLERRGPDTHYTQADCGCDFSRKDPYLVEIYCFASYKTGIKNLNENTIAFEMRTTEYKVSKIVRTAFWGTNHYTLYLNSSNSSIEVKYIPDAKTIQTKIDDYELEKSGNALVWGSKFNR